MGKIFDKWFFLGLLIGTLFFISLNHCAKAEEIKEGYFFRYGIGLNKPKEASIVSIKAFSIGVQKPAFWVLDQQLEGGAFIDSNGDGRKSSAFGSYSIGVSVLEDSYYVKSFWGIALISNTDIRLSSIYEFNNDFEIGLKDRRGVCIGIGYKHLSNAGLVLPNMGRDFILLKLQLPY